MKNDNFRKKYRKFLALAYFTSGLFVLAVAFAFWSYLAAKTADFRAESIDPIVAELLSFDEGPDDTRTLLERAVSHRQLEGSRFTFKGFKQHDENFIDPGFLLVSYFSKSHNQVLIDLIRLKDFRRLHQWKPPLDSLFRKKSKKSQFRAQHPMLLEEGKIVVGSGEGPLLMLDANSKILWKNGRHFHHSIEKDYQGHIVAPIIVQEINQAFPQGLRFRNDGFALLLPDNGKIVKEFSIAKILADNNQFGLLYGIGEVREDQIHLNDVQPVLDSRSFGSEIGDFLLSIRNLSTVALYRPSTNKIIWLKTGPWTLQHDVSVLKSGVISVFGNDAFIYRGKSTARRPSSEVYLYNPESDKVFQPYASIIRKIPMQSTTKGRVRLLENGDAFIEETDKSRLLRISVEKIRWEWVNLQSSKEVGHIHWSRYLTDEEIDLTWLHLE